MTVYSVAADGEVEQRVRGTAESRSEEPASIAARDDAARLLLPLLLDDSGPAKPEPERLLTQAVRCGVLKSAPEKPYFCVLAVMLEQENGTNLTDPVFALTVEAAACRFLQGYSFFVSGRVITLLTADRQETLDEALPLLAGELQQLAARVPGQSCNVGGSRCFDSLAHCHNAYCEALTALQRTGRKKRVVQFLAEPRQPRSALQIRAAVDAIDRAIKVGTAEELQKCLRDAFSALRGDVPRAQRELFLVRLLSAVYGVVCDAVDEESAARLLAESPVTGVALLFRDPGEAERQVTRLCRNAKELIGKKRRVSGEILCDQALAVIGKEFSDPNLTLVRLSQQLHISPNYLSSIMRRITGETFVELLTARRMKLARELVEGTSLRIVEISGRCGYSDEHYFSYCFKKAFGTSPNALRRLRPAR